MTAWVQTRNLRAQKEDPMSGTGTAIASVVRIFGSTLKVVTVKADIVVLNTGVAQTISLKVDDGNGGENILFSTTLTVEETTIDAATQIDFYEFNQRFDTFLAENDGERISSEA